MPTTLLYHTYYTHRETARKLRSVCVGFGPTGIFQLCDQLENIGWTSSVMSLKNIGQDICKKYWQGLIGDEPQKILAKIFAKKTGRVSSVTSFKLTGNDCVRYDQAMAVHFQCNCWRLIHLWKWFGLEGGGEWSSAKGLVAHCCNLFSASISSSELPIEVFSSFGTTRIICWPLFLQQEPLVLQPCG